jgi:hypothetical protein
MLHEIRLDTNHVLLFCGILSSSRSQKRGVKSNGEQGLNFHELPQMEKIAALSLTH